MQASPDYGNQEAARTSSRYSGLVHPAEAWEREAASENRNLHGSPASRNLIHFPS
jgi:hypothetical protein